jgi:hypothetical protein
MYKIIGADGKEYGPIDAGTLRQWLIEGRVNSQTKVLPDGASQWVTFAEVPELAAAAPLVPLTTAAIMPQRTNPLALTGFILGLLSVPFGICCFCAYGLPFSIPAIIFSLIGLTQIRNQPHLYSGKGLGIAGLVLGLLSLLLVAGLFIFGFAMAATDFASEWNKM